MISPSSYFYTKFSKSYADYAERRREYLRSIDDYIAEHLNPMTRLLDIGAGNGLRSRRIADSRGLRDITLLDDSEGMVELARSLPNVRVHKADISRADFEILERHTAILCLWNVMGHIDDRQKRLNAFKNISKLLDDKGVAFVDVNNRYNVSNYGLISVVRNVAKDIISWKKPTGDFVLSMKFGNEDVKTKVHIFSPFEVERLIRKAGLRILEKRAVNYTDGKLSRNPFSGQLLYKLAKR
jgi:2-polyprenyl-3-methyl-5-hydroxy-6-metoxy-1,4-benzoquinol methylase